MRTPKSSMRMTKGRLAGQGEFDCDGAGPCPLQQRTLQRHRDFGLTDLRVVTL